KVTVVNQTFSIPYSSQGGGNIPRTGIQLVNAGKKCFGTKNNYDGTGNNTNPVGIENSTSLNTNTATWYVGENVQSGYSATNATERNRLKAPDAARVTLTGSKTLATDDAYTCHFDVFIGKSSDVSDFSLRRHTNYTLTVNVNNSLEFIRNYVTNSSGNLYYKNDDPRIWHSVASVWVSVNQPLANTYKTWTGSDLTNYPPFNYDGGASSGTTGSDYMGVSSTATISTPYSFEVEKTERGSASTHQPATDYCKGLGTGWRIPTIIELFAMYQNKAALESVSGFAAFLSQWYRSSSVYNGDDLGRCILYFNNGNFSDNNAGYDLYVRCVRDNLPPNKVTINQAVADTYKTWTGSNTAYPPFNYDGGASSGTTGSDRNGSSSAFTVSKEYSIEVSKTQPSGTYYYGTGAAKAECTKLGSGWRLPTQIELFAMYQNKAKLESISGFAAFISNYYWSSSVYNGSAGSRCRLDFNDGGFNYNYTIGNDFVRCVRDI
ncbi:Lcl domain-containing protein, partial [Parabacteroides chinchillae]